MEPDASDREITKTIDDAVAKYYAAEKIAGIPAGWVLLVNDIGTDMEVEPSGVVIVYPNGSMPWATALGIVEMGRIRLHTVFGRHGGADG
jgi:hypothetical protein